jgi:hypothetical protein
MRKNLNFVKIEFPKNAKNSRIFHNPKKTHKSPGQEGYSGETPTKRQQNWMQKEVLTRGSSAEDVKRSGCEHVIKECGQRENCSNGDLKYT